MFKCRHVVNSDTIMHAVHICTVAFSTQPWSSVVSVVISTESLTGARAPQWLWRKDSRRIVTKSSPHAEELTEEIDEARMSAIAFD